MGAKGLAGGVLMAALVIGGCSSGSGMSTSSILSIGTGAKAPLDAPTERSLMVASTAARAVKCGYNFDPTRLKASYIAYETTQGTQQDQVAKVDKSYDFTFAKVAKGIVNPEEYCSEDKTKLIKRDLTRFLAADFSLPPKPAALPKSATSWWWSDEPAKPMNRDEIFNPRSPR